MDLPSQSRAQPTQALRRSVIACIACAAVVGCVVAARLPRFLWDVDLGLLRLGATCGDIGGSVSCFIQMQALETTAPPQTAWPVAHVVALAMVAIVVLFAGIRYPNRAPVALAGAVLATLASFALAFQHYSVQLDAAIGTPMRDALARDGVAAAGHGIRDALNGSDAFWASLPIGLFASVFYLIATLLACRRPRRAIDAAATTVFKYGWDIEFASRLHRLIQPSAGRATEDLPAMHSSGHDLS